LVHGRAKRAGLVVFIEEHGIDMRLRSQVEETRQYEKAR
jgi:hypothetical protein